MPYLQVNVMFIYSSSKILPIAFLMSVKTVT